MHKPGRRFSKDVLGLTLEKQRKRSIFVLMKISY